MNKRINCDNCAGPLQLENKTCEYCGSINPLYKRKSSEPIGSIIGTAMSVCSVSLFTNNDEYDIDQLRSPFDMIDVALLPKHVIQKRLEQLRAQQPINIP